MERLLKKKLRNSPIAEKEIQEVFSFRDFAKKHSVKDRQLYEAIKRLLRISEQDKRGKNLKAFLCQGRNSEWLCIHPNESKLSFDEDLLSLPRALSMLNLEMANVKT